MLYVPMLMTCIKLFLMLAGMVNGSFVHMMPKAVRYIKAVLRRCQTTSAAAESTEGVIEFDNLRLDMNSYELRVKGKVCLLYTSRPAAEGCRAARLVHQRHQNAQHHQKGQNAHVAGVRQLGRCV